MGNSCTKPKNDEFSHARSKQEEIRFNSYHPAEQEVITTAKSKAGSELTDALIYGDAPETDDRISAYKEVSTASRSFNHVARSRSHQSPAFEVEKQSHQHIYLTCFYYLRHHSACWLTHEPVT
jgi:hypothetical protein